VSALQIIQSQSIEVVGELPAISEAMMERRRESIAMMPAFGAAMLEQRRPSPPWLWIAIALVGLALVAVVLAFAL